MPFNNIFFKVYIYNIYLSSGFNLLIDLSKNTLIYLRSSGVTKFRLSDAFSANVFNFFLENIKTIAGNFSF